VLPAPFRFPFRAERAVDVLLLGGGLHLAHVYVPVLPLVVVLGYLVTVLAELADRDWQRRFDSLPGFDSPGTLVRRGIGATLVVVTYLLPATVTLLVTVYGLTGRSLSPDSVTFGTSLGFVAGSTASLLLAISFLYLLPAALVNYVSHGRLRAAFDTEILGTAVSDGGYFYNVAVGIVVGAFLLTVAGALRGIAVGFFVAFYGELVMIAFWSRGVEGIVSDADASETSEAETVEG
jgi:hypothetical protein